jgi:hypothetical protein
MDKRKLRKTIVLKRGGNKVSAVLEKKYLDLEFMLNKISKRAEKLTGKNGMVELDPNNSKHREWYEDDSYERK